MTRWWWLAEGRSKYELLRCRSWLPLLSTRPTDTFLAIGYHHHHPHTNHTCLYSPAARHHRWIKFRLAVLVFRCRSNTAPAYLSRDLHWAADSDARRRLRSSSSNKLVVPRTRLKTVGDRAFGTAAARIWNDLPPTITNASSISAFKKHLKFFLFN